MVKPKKSPGLSSEFAPRASASSREGSDSMKDTLGTRADSDPLRHLTIQVPESLRTELREVALRERTSVRQIVTEAVETHLKSLR